MMMNNPIMQLLQALPQVKANPMQFLIQKKWNVPRNLMGDPDAIVNHLLQTRQIPQEAVNWAYQQAGQLRR